MAIENIPELLTEERQTSLIEQFPTCHPRATAIR